jgi:hypothetical protein
MNRFVGDPVAGVRLLPRRLDERVISGLSGEDHTVGRRVLQRAARQLLDPRSLLVIRRVPAPGVRGRDEQDQRLNPEPVPVSIASIRSFVLCRCTSSTIPPCKSRPCCASPTFATGSNTDPDALWMIFDWNASKCFVRPGDRGRSASSGRTRTSPDPCSSPHTPPARPARRQPQSDRSPCPTLSSSCRSCGATPPTPS